MHRKLTEYTYYEKVCSQNYTYETKKLDGIVDNILELELSKYEAKISKVVTSVLENIVSENFTITEKDIDIIWQYLWLQDIRTDSGRLRLIEGLEQKFQSVRQYPVELREIESKKDKILRFNKVFKNPENLKSILNIPRNNMCFHIAIGEGFLTSDNPVVSTYGKESRNSGFQLIMPVCPCICFTFQSGDLNSSNKLIVQMTEEKIRYVNEATINTANYFVISNERFSFAQESYIYNRFNNENWLKYSRHFYK